MRLRVACNAAYLDATYGDFPDDGPCNAMQLDAELACVALQRVLQQGFRSTILRVSTLCTPRTGAVTPLSTSALPLGVWSSLRVLM